MAASGIESDDVVNIPKSWPADREQQARIIGDWLQPEARGLQVRTVCIWVSGLLACALIGG
jgi:hypothetical protein